MAKKATGKSKSVSSKRKTIKATPITNTKTATSKPPAYLVILGVLIMVVLSFALYKQFQIYQEKQQFEKARKSIEQTTNIIDAAKINLNNCDYGSAKFEKGPLSCQVGVQYMFPEINDDYGNQVIQMIQQLISSKFSVERKDIKLPFNEVNGEYISNSQIFTTDDPKLACHVIYSRLDPSLTPKGIAEVTNNLYIGIKCSSIAKAEHYPVSD